MNAKFLPGSASRGPGAPPLRAAGPIALLAVLAACASDRDARAETERELAERWAAIATPGEHHAHLARMEGEWHTRTTFWVRPDAEPETAEAYTVNRMVMGGRFLRSEFTGEQDGRPLEGVTLIGHDNSRGEYVTTWYENTNTAIAPLSYGRCDGEGRLITFETPRFRDPVSGRTLSLSHYLAITSPDEHRYELWTSYPGQPAYKSLQIVYTRLR